MKNKFTLRHFRYVLVLYIALEIMGGHFGLITLGQLAAAQTALTQTTLSADVLGNAVYSGGSPSIDLAITVGSTTGFVAPVNGAIVSIAYVDREAMGVTGVNTTTKVINVIRGYSNTAVAAHVSGTMVLVGAINTLGANAFFSVDPQGKCTGGGTPSTPWLNLQSGQQWLCSSITGGWVPGFGNPGTASQPVGVTAAVASAAGQITPSGPLFHITGALAITGFLIPVGFNATAEGGGSFCAIPDGTFTTTTANNIALASTAVVNKILCWTWDATNSKFVPTY